MEVGQPVCIGGNPLIGRLGELGNSRPSQKASDSPFAMRRPGVRIPSRPPDFKGLTLFLTSGWSSFWQLTSAAGNPSDCRVDAKRGDYFLQSDFALLIAVSERQIFRLADNLSGTLAIISQNPAS